MTSEVKEIATNIREKLKSSGQYGKMRAMIIQAAVEAISTGGDTDSTTKLFLPTPTESETLETLCGKMTLSLILEFCEFLGLGFTSSVLRLEANLDQGKEDELKSVLEQRKTKFSSLKSSSCALLEVVDEWIYAKEKPQLTKSRSPSPLSEDRKESTRSRSSESSLSNDRPQRSSSSSLSSSASSKSKDAHEKGKTESEKDDDEGSFSSEKPHHDGAVDGLLHPSESGDQSLGEKGLTRKEEEGEPTGKQAQDSTYFVSMWRGRTVTRVGEVSGEQVQLEYLQDCKVLILDPLDSATVDDCEGGEFIIAACEGSVFLRNCKNMTVHVACKQLRLRDCEGVEVHLFTTTDPVVEMSHHIVFLPFHVRLPLLEEHFKSAKLDAAVNRFVHVYDFTKDDTSLPLPHFTVRFPHHGVAMEDRCGEFGHPNCPTEIEDLLEGRLMPAASSEAGPNKSHDIKTGVAVWNSEGDTTGAATISGTATASFSIGEAGARTTKSNPPLPPLRGTPTAAESKDDDDEYSDFDDDTGSGRDGNDEVSVEEDDDEF